MNIPRNLLRGFSLFFLFKSYNLFGASDNKNCSDQVRQELLYYSKIYEEGDWKKTAQKDEANYIYFNDSKNDSYSYASVTIDSEKVPEFKISFRRKCNDINLQKDDEILADRLSFTGKVASETTFNCNQARLGNVKRNIFIVIQSKTKNISEDPPTATFERPENVTIKNCLISGQMLIQGMSNKYLVPSSKAQDHIQRSQDAAPKNITIENSVINKYQNSVWLYFGSGVTYSKLINSKLTGSTTGSATGIYLDAESAYNEISGNSLVAALSEREQIAVDGSAFNKIKNNIIHVKSGGGILLYRNCGEHGVSRHQTPSKNEITNNYFAFYGNQLPAVWIGSRRGMTRKGTKSYCNDDINSPYENKNPKLRFGSSLDDRDFASNNLVEENKFLDKDPKQDIWIGTPKSDSNNIIQKNMKVTMSEDEFRKSINDDSQPPLTITQQSAPETTTKPPEPKQTQTPTTQTLTFYCGVEKNNQGCSGEIPRCPAGMHATAIKAACNLEYGDTKSIKTLEWNKIRVDNASDNISEGKCQVGDKTISSGEAPLSLLIVSSDKSFSCKEHDKNGGDCVIRGLIQCSKD
jgi:hypothetical protein